MSSCWSTLSKRSPHEYNARETGYGGTYRPWSAPSLAASRRDRGGGSIKGRGGSARHGAFGSEATNSSRTGGGCKRRDPTRGGPPLAQVRHLLRSLRRVDRRLRLCPHKRYLLPRRVRGRSRAGLWPVDPGYRGDARDEGHPPAAAEDEVDALMMKLMRGGC